VEGLEDEPDGVLAQPGQGPLAHLVYPAPGQPNLPARRPVQAWRCCPATGASSTGRPVVIDDLTPASTWPPRFGG